MKMKSKPKKGKTDGAEFADVMKRIKPVETLPLKLSMVVYGRPGTGKTTFASSFPGPTLLLDIKEDGTDSVADIEGLDILRITSWDEFEQTYWYLKSGKHHYRSVIIDAVTELQDLAIEKWRGSRGEDEPLGFKVWGQVSGSMKTWLINYRDLINSGMDGVCFIAHDRVHDIEEGGTDQLDPEVGPRLMPSVASYLCGAVKVIGYTYIREVKKSKDPLKKDRSVEYRMRLGPHAYYTTKVRRPKSGLTPDSIINPTHGKIIDIMRGDYEPAKKSLTKTKRSK